VFVFVFCCFIIDTKKRVIIIKIDILFDTNNSKSLVEKSQNDMKEILFYAWASKTVTIIISLSTPSFKHLRKQLVH